jgi:hypothetical protein
LEAAAGGAVSIKDPHLMANHDDDAEVYVNGVLAASLRGSSWGYVTAPIGEEARAALRWHENLLAVHCKNTGVGGQYIDVGLVDIRQFAPAEASFHERKDRDSTVNDAARELLGHAVAWYRAEGDADDSAGKHHGKLAGGTAITPIKFGHAFDFDGKDGCVLVRDAPEPNPTAQFSIMAWVCPRSLKYDDGSSRYAFAIAKTSSDSGAHGFNLGIAPEGLYAQINAAGDNAVWAVGGSMPCALNEWAHIAATYDGHNFVLYKNGTAVGTANVGRKSIIPTDELIIGGGAHGMFRFCGLIDDAALFDRALSPKEINTIYLVTLDGRITSKRLPVPEGKESAAAKQKAERDYAKAWNSAKILQDRVAVARNMYTAGVRETANQPLRFTLLERARDRAASLGDGATAFDAVEALDQAFEIDGLAWKANVLSTARKHATLPSQAMTIGLSSLGLADRAMIEERFDLATEFCELAAAAGQGANNQPLAAAAEARAAMARIRQDLFYRFRQAIDKLAAEPDDPTASLEVARYACLFHGDRSRALSLAARSGDSRWVSIAALEPLAEHDPAQRLPLIVRWLDASEKETGLVRTECCLQAKYWLLRGFPDASTVDDATRRQLDEAKSLSGMPMARLEPGLVAEFYEGLDFKTFRARRVDPQIAFNFSGSPPAAGLPADYFSIRWSGWLKPPMAGKYVISTKVDDGIRVRVDGKVIIDSGGTAAAEIELGDAPHALVVEYNQHWGDAYVWLRWSLKDLSEEQLMPPEVLFHDAASETGN